MLISLLLASAQPIEAPPPAPDCSYDLEAMLALDLQAFDQDLDGGWRVLHKIGCYSEAAELIRIWRHAKRSHASILYTHEGQMRGYAGQIEEAIALLRLTYKPMDDDANFGWNFYMDGTIAFLRRDREGLEEAIKRLKAVPIGNVAIVNADGTPANIRWPPNLHVLEGFERCWDKSFVEANISKQCINLTFETDG